MLTHQNAVDLPRSAPLEITINNERAWRFRLCSNHLFYVWEQDKKLSYDLKNSLSTAITYQNKFFMEEIDRKLIYYNSVNGPPSGDKAESALIVAEELLDLIAQEEHKKLFNISDQEVLWHPAHNTVLGCEIHMEVKKRLVSFCEIVNGKESSYIFYCKLNSVINSLLTLNAILPEQYRMEYHEKNKAFIISKDKLFKLLIKFPLLFPLAHDLSFYEPPEPSISHMRNNYKWMVKELWDKPQTENVNNNNQNTIENLLFTHDDINYNNDYIDTYPQILQELQNSLLDEDVEHTNKRLKPNSPPQ